MLIKDRPTGVVGIGVSTGLFLLQRLNQLDTVNSHARLYFRIGEAQHGDGIEDKKTA